MEHTPNGIPVIDFSSFGAGDAAEREICADIAAAARDSGCFYLRATPVNGGEIADGFARAREFFALPDAVKQTLLKDGGLRGYDGFGSQVLDPKKLADWKESFRIWPEGKWQGAVNMSAPWSILVDKPNKWPAELPAFKETSLSLREHVAGIIGNVLAALERGLGKPAGSFTDFHDGYYPIRWIHYPKVNAPKKDQDPCGEHTDFGLLTALLTNAGGLEAQLKDGKYVMVEPLGDDHIFFNIGDMLSAITNGELVSTRHRVHAVSMEHEKYSAAIFGYPRLDRQLTVGGEVMTGGDYVAKKLRLSHGM